MTRLNVPYLADECVEICCTLLVMEPGLSVDGVLAAVEACEVVVEDASEGVEDAGLVAGLQRLAEGEGQRLLLLTQLHGVGRQLSTLISHFSCLDS